MKSITQKLQDDIRKILEANLHPNQQKIDVHEPEKDELTAHDFKKLRDMKKGKSKDDMQKDEAADGMKKKHTMQELSGKAAQQAAVAISLIKAGKKDGKMPKPMEEDAEQVDELSTKTLQSYTRKATTASNRASNRADKEEDKAMSTDGEKYPDKQARHNTAANQAVATMVKRNTGLKMAGKRLANEEQTDEAMSHQAATTMKHIPNASPALKKAAKDIKPGIAGYRDRIAMLKAGGVKEEAEVEESIDETIVKHDSFTVDIKDSYTFGEYLTAAKQLVGEEEAVKYANDAFRTQDLTIFMMEEMSRGDIESNINAHRKAGHTVSMPKYSTKDGKPHAEYTVTDKDEGTRRKYIHHGNVRKVENMGAKG